MLNLTNRRFSTKNRLCPDLNDADSMKNAMKSKLSNLMNH